jgi:GTP-binding protein Era
MSDHDDIFADDWPPDHRSGVVAVVGRPNVGKSSLINAVLGQKIAIATPKPQTTRRQQLGIYTTSQAQILFVDTPGIHKPHNRLGEYMLGAAEAALKDADAIVWIIDASDKPQAGDQYIAERLTAMKVAAPVLLVLNKVDLLKGFVDFTEHVALAPNARVLHVSALTGKGVQTLCDELAALLPVGPRYYPVDQLSDQNMRFIAAEIIREKIINNTDKEVPHSVAVEIDGYREEQERVVISAIIYVERESQRGILVGRNGSMIKKIGTEARMEIVGQVNTAVHLDLRVKVLTNWRDDEALMRRVGYRKAKGEEE